MDLSLLNNKFCDPKFHTIFLTFMPLILSLKEDGEIKNKNKNAFKPTNIPYPLQTKIIPKIQILHKSILYKTTS